MRKPSRQVELDDVIASSILGDDPEVIALVMKVHLALEAMLIEMISTFRSDDKIYRISFPNKTELLEQHGLIGTTDRLAFDRFNNFRNDFAHIFGHEVSLDAALTLARELEKNGVEFSDSLGHYSLEQAIEYYEGLLGVLTEIGWCILYHAASLLIEVGGRDIFGN